jgi:hypothetical protein
MKTTRSIEVDTRSGRGIVAASAVSGDYAAHRAVRMVDGKAQAVGRRWCVTHIPTGRAVVDDLTGLVHASAVMARLELVAGLSAALSSLVANPADRAARGIVASALSGTRDRTLFAVTRPA